MENMDKGLTVPKWVLIVCLKIQQMPQNLFAQFVCPSTKVQVSMKKGFIGCPYFCICCILTWFAVALKWNCFDLFTSTIFKICNKYTVGFLQRFDTSFGVKVMVKIKLISNPTGPGHVVLAVQWIRLRKYYQIILFQNKKYWAAKQQISWVIAPGGFSSLTFDQAIHYYSPHHQADWKAIYILHR